MRLLLFAATILTAWPGWAQTNNPEIVSYSDYQAMTPANQYAYLQAVGQALGEFEAAYHEVFAADEFASYPYFRELFAEIADEVVPRAHAALVDAVECGKVHFEVPDGSKIMRMCNKVGTNWQCIPLGPSSYKDIAAIKEKCPNQYARDPKVAGLYQAFAERQTNNAFAKNGGSETADANAGKALDTKPTNKSAGCDAVSASERPKVRKAYRADPNAKCLMAGVESEYSPTSGRCDYKRSHTSPTGKSAKCTAKNTYTSAGKLGKVPPGKRTACLGSLYCTKTGEPYCVEANKTAFPNCHTAFEKNSGPDQAGLQFGPACVNNDRQKYKELETSISGICDKEVARSLLCNDCNALREKLHLAESKFAAITDPKKSDEPKKGNSTGAKSAN